MNISDVQEDEGKEVVDPEFNEKIQGQPILEFDSDRKVDDNIQVRTFNVIRYTQRWLKDRHFGQPISAPKSRKVGWTHENSQASLSPSDIAIDVVGNEKQRTEKTNIANLGEPSLGSAPAHVTRSRSRESSQKLFTSSLVVDLDYEEETQWEMDTQM